jgi:hypothetical protein
LEPAHDLSEGGRGICVLRLRAAAGGHAWRQDRKHDLRLAAGQGHEKRRDLIALAFIGLLAKLRFAHHRDCLLEIDNGSTVKIRRGQLHIAQGWHLKHIFVADLLGDRKAAQIVGRQELRPWVFRHSKPGKHAAADIDAVVAIRTAFIDENF